MRKIFIYGVVFLFLFIPIAYSGFWYFSAYKIKNLLANYINVKKSDISYDLSRFPFTFIFLIKNPKFSNEKLAISSETLLIKNKPSNKSIYIYTPSNKVNIAVHDNEKKNIKCNINNNNHFVIRLNDLPSSLQFNKNSNIIDHINTLRYEDYGLKCDISEDQQSITTQVDDKNNYIQFYLSKKLNENTKLEFDFYIYKYKHTANPENYLSIKTKFNYEFINCISASKINFNIEKFLIHGNNFSLVADGRINNYNLFTSSFKDKINVAISNYKELIFFVTDESKTSDVLKKLMFSLSEKVTDNDIQFSIKYDDNLGSSFIGKLSAIDFVNQITKLAKNENSN